MSSHKVHYNKKKEFADAKEKPVEHRNIIVLMDGTWNDETGKDGDGVVTNIVKLYRCLGADTDTQITRYFRGVGNDDDYGAFLQKLGGFAGASEKSIRDDAYSTVVKEYRPGDHIFIFGFSRGAASARMLASQINREGIPEEITIYSKSKASKTTRNIENRFHRYEATDEKVEDYEHPPVQFLGVWDTVDAFGIPFSMKLLKLDFQEKNLFKNKTIAPNIQQVLHLVSIDETRNPFIPTLMNWDKKIKEIWFPGVHSDIGGGYKEDELGRITLKYMIDFAKAHAERTDGVKSLTFDDPLVTELTDTSQRVFHFHFHGLKWSKLGVGKATREIKVIEEDPEDPNKSITSEERKPIIHRSLDDVRRSGFTYSIVPPKGFFKKSPQQKYRIQYNPPYLRIIKGKYEIVS